VGSVARMLIARGMFELYPFGEVYPGVNEQFRSRAGEEPASMDSIVIIMFGSLLCTVTALNFMELRRIRKKLETKQS
jgi:hypothetical protein